MRRLRFLRPRSGIAAAFAVALSAASTLVRTVRADPTWGGVDVSVSPFAWRALDRGRGGFQPGFALAAGPTTAGGDDPGRFTSLLQLEATMFDTRSYAVAVSAAAFEAAARIGAFEPTARVGVVFATVDSIGGQWSAELLSPRALVGFGIRVGHLRFTLGAQTEYFWRWFGPSLLEHGLVFDFRYEKLQIPPDALPPR